MKWRILRGIWLLAFEQQHPDSFKSGPRVVGDAGGNWYSIVPLTEASWARISTVTVGLTAYVTILLCTTQNYRSTSKKKQRLRFWCRRLTRSSVSAALDRHTWSFHATLRHFFDTPIIQKPIASYSNFRPSWQLNGNVRTFRALKYGLQFRLNTIRPGV